MKLSIELVPKSCWYSNVRTNVSKKIWDKIRRTTYQKANNKCEICDGQGNKWPVECHEIWDYNFEQKIQKLIGFIALCPICHQVKHFGRTQLMGVETKAINQLMKVNNWTNQQVFDHINESFMLWNKRNTIKWSLDISHIDNFSNQ